MFQAIHILRKDVRYLWPEICFFGLLAALFGWKEELWASALLLITGCYAIAKLILAEPIPGDTQFWITRPYDPKSLLGAKLLFIALFLNVPLLVARVVILLRHSYDLQVELIPLLWSQLLFFAGFCLPIAAMAATTSEMRSFIMTILVLVTAGLIMWSWAIPVLPRFLPQAWPEGVIWIRMAFLVTALIAGSIAVLYFQYAGRKTLFSRATAAIVFAMVIALQIFVPPAFGMELQTRLSRRPDFASRLQVAVHGEKLFIPKPSGPNVILLSVAEIPPNVEAHPDGASLEFDAPDGRSWRIFTDRIQERKEGKNLYSVAFGEPKGFPPEQKDLRLRGSLYLTAFGPARSKSITLTTTPQNVSDGLQCDVDQFRGVIGQLRCRSAFRWPGLLVSAKVRDDLELMEPFISYSPFPAGMELDYVEEHRAGGPPPHNPVASIVVREPIAHFRTDFVIDHLGSW